MVTEKGKKVMDQIRDKVHHLLALFRNHDFQGRLESLGGGQLQGMIGVILAAQVDGFAEFFVALGDQLGQLLDPDLLALVVLGGFCTAASFCGIFAWAVLYGSR